MVKKHKHKKRGENHEFAVASLTNSTKKGTGSVEAASTVQIAVTGVSDL